MGQVDVPSKATAPQDAGAEASKRAGPKVSTKLMGLKFMQRAKAKKDMSIQAKAAKKALEEEHFQIEMSKETGCVVLVEDEPFAGSGRISFQNFNPDVDKINEEHKSRMQDLAVEAAEKADVSEAEMANVLGKRKQVNSGGLDGGCSPQNEPAGTAKQQATVQESSRTSECASVTIHIPKKSKSSKSKPSFSRVSEMRSKKTGRIPGESAKA